MKITITCYNRTEQMERKAALRKFREGVLACDGSERDRYESIVAGIEMGCTEVDDGWEWARQYI